MVWFNKLKIWRPIHLCWLFTKKGWKIPKCLSWLIGHPSTLYEYNNTGDNNYTDNPNWWGQSFTPATSHTITSCKIKAFRVNSPGTATVSIKNTDGSGLPTGGDLTSGTINANDFTTNEAGAWYEISLTPYNLTAGVKYAIIVRSSTADGSNYVAWRFNGNTYAVGCLLMDGTDGESAWGNFSNAYDAQFEDWGEPLVVGRSQGLIF